MAFTFTFALSQNQTFELRCNYGTRRLDADKLASLINLCEEKYYAQRLDDTAQLRNIGRELYSWLDGKEGWLRRALDETDEGRIYLDLIQTSEAQSLNPQTQKVALGLAHLPWELLHDGTVFLLQRHNAPVPVRTVQQRNTSVLDVQNRPLRLLFMATSPEHPGIAPLQFEEEEKNILTATKEQPLALIVEESGSVIELGNLVQSEAKDYFDVFHLTGHGVIYTEAELGRYLPKGRKIKDYTPCFITEDDEGKVEFTTVDDLAKAFQNRFPRVVFLSGCHTGQIANQGTVPSMAQALVKAGAGVVLGWARPVFDRTGIIAAQALYHALATGATVEDAVKAAQQEMIAQECSDWHLLRIYRDSRAIGELVTPLNTKKREKLKFTPPESEFLDENNIVKVASHGEFVGRRKALQRGMRALKQTSDDIGVFIAGMGGLGKSSLAARLCTRVQAQRPKFERVVLIGVVDEVGLINKLASKYERFAGVPALLNQPGISFKGRLQNFFAAIEDEHDKPVLLVLDDFEQNIPQENVADGSLRMTTAAYDVLAALCAALAENQAESRLIVTCRYLEENTLPPHRLHLESLAAMGEADINKIYWQLDGDVQLQLKKQRLLKIADGNPRLLKWLVEVVQLPDVAEEELLTKLEGVQLKFRENILAETLLNALEDEEKQFLAQLSVFRLPVTIEIINSVSSCSLRLRSVSESQVEVSQSQVELNSPFPTPRLLSEVEVNSLVTERSAALSLSKGRSILPKLISLSLVESATTYAKQTPEYRVTTILAPLLQPLLTEEEWQTTQKAATQIIYRSWWEEVDNKNEEQAREIVRLAVLAQEKEIAVSVGDDIANSWVNSSRYVETWELCQAILQLGDDYRILGTIARAEETLGFVKEALTHYEQALELCPEDDLTRKAATLHNMAGLKAQQGDVTGALALVQQSLNITDSINDVQGKAATLHEMAGLKAQQGDVTGALALYQQSLDITDSINDVKRKAATLHEMAGLKAQQGDVTGALALYQQSLDIKESINDVRGKAATLHQMAGLKAQQGDVAGALALYQQSLDISDSINDVKTKGAILHAMAGLKAQQGDVTGAIALYQQSLDISDSINDVRGKAATLHQMAGLKAQQGDVTGAIALYQQSLDIKESINDVRGKATTLANMAYWEGKRGNKAKQLELNLQAAQLLGQVNAYLDLCTILNNLGVADETKGIIYLAQGVWLCLRVQVPLHNTIDTLWSMYNLVSQGDDIKALLGATAMYLCQLRGDQHPQLEELRDDSFKILVSAAAAQGIETREAFDAWIEQQQLNNPDYFIPRLVQLLEAIVGDEWLFERF
ncbi:tetratricopeptide repeat protein [Nostoc sp. FACHB-87]|uniref:tetratricopeptide repeat protein n=1 Tax=Nostocaceae TaxID=1162 RepID=UPI00168345F7|nr:MULTISPECIES: tetratricopeptide repeat protein [Nostocaceae]MBD2455513.1 tetratricopeptide repeat protein [Nostoc sp. FACHB-87]MBD2478594.1 tetratricopeptide repeat protein [Anabaena sp. FACHB-83]